MMPFADLLRFDGRTTRLGYWRRVLLLNVILAVVWVVGVIAVMAVGPWGGILFLPAIPLVVASLANVVRRLHDRDRGVGWAVLFLIGPWSALALAQMFSGSEIALGLATLLMGLVNFGFNIWGFIEIGCRRGTVGPNRYGPEPVTAS